MNIDWQLHDFKQLSNYQLYDLIQLRLEIFVIEQDCIYQDLDNKDQQSYHLMGYVKNELVAYVRILPPGISYPNSASIGRVVIKDSARGKGLGIVLMQKSIDYCKKLFSNNNTITISAQCYLDRFYKDLGFIDQGDHYLEDGIEHQKMKLSY